MKLFISVFVVVFSLGAIGFTFAWFDQVDRKEAQEADEIEFAEKLAILEQQEEENKETSSAFVETSTPTISINSYEPTVGMTAEEVQNSSWGFPNDVSKTTNEYGTTEMWVYPDNNYLHFKDGLLVSIVEGNY